MYRIVIYSLLLVVGMLASQVYDLSSYHTALSILTMVCLGYIMIEVGLEFVIDKKNLRPYGKDFVIALSAAMLPWIFCASYFYYIIGAGLEDAMLVGLFSAPTSAGVLFTMLAAAGLGITWLFKKARILAIFDDIATILLMVPLQFFHVGFKPQTVYLLVIMIMMIIIAYLALHRLRLPTKSGWLLLYSLIVVAVAQFLHHIAYIELEVILPAFCLGAVLYNPHDPSKDKQHEHEHAYIEPEEPMWLVVDGIIKYSFMFLVGCSMPRIVMGLADVEVAAMHVIALTIISNIGKLLPAFCYRNEAAFKERVALSIAMFPRGEVGAGVLLIALSYGLMSNVIALGALSLELNLLLTGLFISFVIWLIKPRTRAYY